MLRNLGIRWQILSALALPVLVLGLISSQVTYQALVDMREASQSRELARAAGGFADLVGGLQAERALSVAVVIGQPGADKQLKSVRAAVDQGLAAIRTRVYADSSSAAVRVVLARSAVGHTSLPALRTEVDSGKMSPRDIVTRYSQVIAADVAVPSDLAETFRTQEAATNFQQFAELSVAGEALAQEQLVGTTAILSGKASTADQRALGAVVGAGQQALATYDRTAQAKQKATLQQALGAKAARSADLAAARAAFQAAGTAARPKVTLAEWTAVTTAQRTALRGALNSINQDGIDLSTADYDSARNQLLLTLGGAIAITLLTLLLALGLSRRISAPMRRLTLAATQIRDELPRIVATAQSDEDYDLHLPVVQIVGTNEVSRLAAAFVDVNAVTVAIAREQARLRAAVADMFVNVARRNQVLLSRQLSLIDQLERNEVNPDALEELFRLDHLATRMRRNAESLLVLAGIESGRRLRQPMPLSDVVRTATSEIEHYHRVSLSLGVDPPVFAHLALPIAHLLAELLENATNFSDPGSTVVVMAAATNHGIRMTVADDGLGIPADELIEINARIEEPPTAEALSSQRLGFFVVGRLAQRLDAKVTLTSGRAGGTAALIDLPSSLFVPGSLDSSFGGSLNEAISGYTDVQEQPFGSALAGIPDQGGAPAWTPEPAAALAASSPFVAAFPSATSATAAAGLPAQTQAPTPVALPALPVAFNSAAFDAENLEPAWTPQPDNLPFGQAAAPVVEQAAPGLPARRSAAEPLAGPQALPLPVAATITEPVDQPINEPVNEPLALPVAEPTLVQAVAVDPITGLPVEVTPEWAESDWAVSAWATPAEEPAEEVSAPAAPVAEQSGPSIFSAFRSRQAAAGPQPEPEAVLPVLDWTTPVEPVAVPMVFLDSAEAVDTWFDADAPIEPSEPFEPDRWQAWDDVATVPASADPAPMDVGPAAWSDDDGDGYLPPQESFATAETPPIPSAPAAASPALDPTPASWGSEPTPVEAASWMPLTDAYDPTPVAQAPESMDDPVDYSSIPETWTPETDDSQPVPEAWAPESIPEVWAPEPVASGPVADLWAPEPAVPAWTPQLESAPAAWTPEPVPVPEAWTPALEAIPVPEAWTPELEPAAWTPEPEPAAWTPEPEPAAWTPEPAAEAWTLEPALAAWTPEPAREVRTAEPQAEAWTPEPAAEAPEPEPAPAAWTSEPVAYQPAPEPWTPEPEPTSWALEPAAWTPDPQQEVRPEPAAVQPLMQTLTAAIDILPQRTSIRTALRRGRRKGDPQPANGLPFNGGFDPIASAREFAQREGFGSPVEPTPEPAFGVPAAEPSGVPTPSGLVPEPSRPWESASVPVERRQHPRPSDQSSQSGRSALASEALTELSRLSSYSPTSMPSSEKAGLQRRTPSDVPIDDAEPIVDSAGQRGARTAASVRSMLAGFKAGVERGRTSPAANRPALPPPPRSSSSEARDE